MNKTLCSLLGILFVLSFQSEAQQILNKQSLKPDAIGFVNVKQMAARDALLPRPNSITTVRVPNQEEEDFEEPYSPFSPAPARGNAPANIAVSSPSPILNYEAAPDEALGGGTS